jgi:WD40 repeat protein/Tfp pilus assembly protein PilF
MRVGPCVSEHELREMIRGELPDRIARAITRHVETCPQCEETARRLDGETDPVLQSIRAAARRNQGGDASLSPTTAALPGNGEATPSTSSVREILPHAVVGFEILRELGRGGTSVVYQARQEHPARVVALKLLLGGGHAGAEHCARFMGEADALARLQHPQIVHVFEAGRHEGTPFLVLEYMGGGSLGQKLAGAPQPARGAAELVEGLARAVQHAHGQGVIHRDLKPANVLLTEEGMPKIADFGLAKQERPDLTASGAILGTPSYMAPEQAAGDSRTTGPAADIYALGAILYELLTGRPPFRAATVLETLEHVRLQEPLAPHQLQPATPRDLSTICLKCLQKEPARRYADAGELADDLRRFQEGRPILARPVGPAGRAWRWTRRNPGWAAMFASVAALLVTIAVVATRLSMWALQAETRTREKLFESRLAEARAFSLSHLPGQHFASLALLEEAGDLARSLRLPAARWADLRQVAITALVRPDLYPERTWPGLPEGSDDVCMDEDLQIYARTDQRGNCSIRRVDGDQEIHFLPGPEAGPTKVESALPFLSPDARFVGIVHGDGRLQLWKLDQPRAEVWFEDTAVHRVHFRPDSTAVAIGHRQGAISVYDLTQRRAVFRLVPDGLTREIEVALHPTEPLIAVTSYFADFMQVRDLRTGKVIKAFETQDGGYCVAWDPAGHLLAINEGDHATIRLYDRVTFALRGTVGPTGPGCRFTFNHAGNRLAARDWTGSIQLFDVATGRLLFEIPLAHPTLECRFSRDDRRLGVFIHGNHLGIWQVADGQECQPLLRPLAPPGQQIVGDVAVSPGGRLGAGTVADGFTLWDLPRRTELAFLPLEGGRFVLFMPGPEAALVTGDQSGTFRWPLRQAVGHPDLWRLGPPQPLALPPSPYVTQSADGKVLAVAFRPVGPWMPWGGAWIWHADRPDRPLHLAPDRYIREIALSPDGKRLVTTDDNAGVQVWDARTGALVRSLNNQPAKLDFSPDGRWLATGISEGYVHARGRGCLFDTTTWNAVRELDNQATFAPDGRHLLMRTDTSVLRLVEAATGRELTRLELPDLSIPRSCHFTPDGATLLCVDDKDSLRVCNLRRLRAQLAERGLDWDAAPYPPEPPVPDPIRIEVDWGDYQRLSKLEIVKNYDRAVEAAPQLAVRWHRRGLFHQGAGRYELALRDLRKAVELEPRKPIYLHDLARLYVLAPETVRDTRQAVILAEQAVRTLPGEWFYHNTLGLALYRAGRADEAIVALERSMKGGGGLYDALNLYVLALCYHRLGQSGKAQDCFRRAVAWRKARKQLTTEWAADLDLLEAEARAVQ